MKKLAVTLIIVLLGFDISILFAAQKNRPQDSKQNTPYESVDWSSLSNADPDQPETQHTQKTKTTKPTQKQTTQAKQTQQETAQATNSEQVSQLNSKDIAFNNTLDSAFPMTPQQIFKLKQVYDNAQFAASAQPKRPPEPTFSSLQVSLAPQAKPPVIRLAQGFVTSLVFLDATGAPWPITAYDIGNPSAFNVQWDKADNVLMVQAMDRYTYGNLAIKLHKLATPVMVSLVPGQKEIDYRADLHVAANGPNAKAQMINSSGQPAGANAALLEMLNGVPPQGADSVNIKGGDAEAWLLGDKLYLRTRLTVLSPSWISKMSSGDGTSAYEMPKTPMILVAERGKTVSLRLEGL